MSKNSLILFFGGLVIIVPFLGLPSAWKTIIFALLGVGIVIVTLMLRRDIASGELYIHLQKDTKTDSYAQNGVLTEKYRDTTEKHGTKYEKEEDTAENKKNKNS